LLCLGAFGANAKERVMFGDDIYVGPDEVLDEVVCIFCSVTIDGRVGEAVAIMGGMEINGEVDRDAVAIMGGMDIRGQIGGDMAAIMGGAKVRSGGSVGGDAIAVLGGIDLADGTSIGGDTVEWSFGDTFAAPLWNTIAHEASDDTIMFCMSDEALMQWAGYYRFEALQ